MSESPPKPWPLRRLLLAAYVGLLGAALLLVSLGIRGLVGRFLDQAGEHAAWDACAESWYRLGLPATKYWSAPPHGAVLLAERISPAQVESLVRDLARPERIVRWRGVNSDQVVEFGGRPRQNGRPAPPPPDVQWWSLALTTPSGPVGVLEMGLDRGPDRLLLQALARYLFVCSAVVLLLAVWVCFRLSTYWLAPLQGLNETLEALADGDLSARPPETAAAIVPVEWRRLRQSAARMAARLESSFTTQRRFISDASHELRTPLTAVTAMAEMLESDSLGPEARAKAQRTILNESERMRRLVEDLLALSRADEGRPLPEGTCLLRDTLEALKEEFAETHPQRALQFSCPPEAVVDAPTTMVHTVVRNLLENALRYSEGAVECRVSTAAETVTVVVEDTGCGIPEEELEKVFERFYRSDHSRSRATGGSGLGLAIVKMMVERTGGEISLASRLGQGTTVTVVWRGAKA